MPLRLPWPTADARLTRLLGRAKDGDRDAFRAAYRALYPRVSAYVARRTAGRDETEEVVARTFHRLLEKLQSFDPARGEAVAFALSIARNLLIDDARARRPSVDLDALDPAASPALTEARTPLTELLVAEEVRELQRRLAALPAEARELISLRYGDGLSHRQIADLMSLTEDAVKQRFSRLLRELRTPEADAPERKGALA